MIPAARRPRLVLASTSPHRRALLARLRVAFSTAAPAVDESEIAGEPPDARALRLAEEKARAIAVRRPRAVVVGGDQTIAADGANGRCEIFDKPQTAARAARQLAAMRGRELSFYTGLAVALPARGKAPARLLARLTTHRVTMRRASMAEIRRYVEKEPSPNCAGGAQIEGLGIALVESIEGGDPTALLGMSLIELAAILRAAGYPIP